MKIHLDIEDTLKRLNFIVAFYNKILKQFAFILKSYTTSTLQSKHFTKLGLLGFKDEILFKIKTKFF